MDYETIIFSKEENYSLIQLNRPERMNAVIEEMYLEILDALEKAKRDDTVRCLILTGSVLKRDGIEKQAFCAGADLKKHATGERTHAQKRDYIRLAHETTKQLFEFPKPTIAAVNGPARGAGLEMALNCDLLLIAENATVAFPETGLGTFIGGGVTSHLPRIVGLMRAKELVYTGKVLNGQEAVEIGLALNCFPIESLMAETKNIAKVLGEKAPISMGFGKQRIQNSYLHDLDTVLDLETDAIITCMDTEDWLEGTMAFNEKRKPIYKGR